MSKKKKTQPRLRFKDDKGNDFPEWEEKKLGEIGEIVSGLTYSPDDVVDEGGVLVLRSSNINERRLAFDNNVFVQTEKYNPVNENDILICVRNGSKNLIGKNALIKKENAGLAFGAFMTVYRSPYNRFLFHWFDTEEYKKKVGANLGATINSINGSDLKKFKVPFPNVNEQEKIANFLCALDDKIENLEKELEELKSYKKGVMQAIFVSDSDADKDQRSKIKDQLSAASYKKSKDGKLNNYEIIRFKDESENDYPDWVERTLEEICVTFKSGEGITAKEIFEEGKYPVYGGNGLRGYTNSYTHDGFYILIGRQGALCGNINRAKGKTYVSEHAIAVQTNESSDTEWLAQNLEFMNLNKYSESSAQPGLAVNKLVKLKIFTPILEEQKKIAGFLLALDNKVNYTNHQIESTRQYKQALLQQLFN
jgi:restriction endonuclease S subunit